MGPHPRPPVDSESRYLDKRARECHHRQPASEVTTAGGHHLQCFFPNLPEGLSDSPMLPVSLIGMAQLTEMHAPPVLNVHLRLPSGSGSLVTFPEGGVATTGPMDAICQRILRDPGLRT